MRVVVALAIFLQTTPVLGCRIVCSQGKTLWHLLRDGETSETFQVLQDSDTVMTGLKCHHLTPSGTDAEREEQRLVNLCVSAPDANGRHFRFTSERVQRRGISLADGSPTERQEDLLVWTLETRRRNLNADQDEIEKVQKIEMDRKECGSSAER